MSALGPYSRGDRRRKLDGRTLIGRHVRAFERQMLQTVGPEASFPVRALVDQAVGIELQIALLEDKGIVTDLDRRCYAALLNHKRLTLREIGLEAPPAKRMTLDEAMALELAQEATEEAAAEAAQRARDEESAAQPPILHNTEVAVLLAVLLANRRP